MKGKQPNPHLPGNFSMTPHCQQFGSPIWYMKSSRPGLPFLFFTYIAYQLTCIFTILWICTHTFLVPCLFLECASLPTLCLAHFLLSSKVQLRHRFLQETLPDLLLHRWLGEGTVHLASHGSYPLSSITTFSIQQCLSLSKPEFLPVQAHPILLLSSNIWNGLEAGGLGVEVEPYLSARDRAGLPVKLPCTNTTKLRQVFGKRLCEILEISIFSCPGLSQKTPLTS